MTPNKFYLLSNIDLFPPHMLTDENTMCLRYTLAHGKVDRVYPTDYFEDVVGQLVVLVNPKQEDLTYLTLLGVKYTVIASSASSYPNFETLYSTGIFYLDGQSK